MLQLHSDNPAAESGKIPNQGNSLMHEWSGLEGQAASPLIVGNSRREGG